MRKIFTNKKAIFIILIIIVMIVLGCMYLPRIIVPYQLYQTWKTYGGVTDFDKYKDDYDAVVNLVYDFYLKNPKEGLYF